MRHRIALVVVTLAIASGAIAAPPTYKNGDKLQAPKPAARSAGARQIEWDDLMPADWDPMQGMRVLQFAKLGDSDPRAIEALAKLKKAWDEAPVVPAMDRQRIAIAGFAVPLDAEGETVHELLLVPYFGACIHVPPPPSNQIVHVTSELGVKVDELYQPYWIEGDMQVKQSTSDLADAGYSMEAQKIYVYELPE